MKRFAAVLVPCILAAVLAGCGPRSNMIPLEYIALGPEQGLCSKPVAVGTFIDRRTADDLGHDHMRTFYPQDVTVEQWVADAFGAELAARGCTVEKDDPSSPFNPATVLKGDVRQVSVIRDGWDYRMEIQLGVKIYREGEPVFQKVYHGVWERTFLSPSETRYRDMLRTGLQDLLGDVMKQLAPLLGSQ